MGVWMNGDELGNHLLFELAVKGAIQGAVMSARLTRPDRAPLGADQELLGHTIALWWR